MTIANGADHNREQFRRLLVDGFGHGNVDDLSMTLEDLVVDGDKIWGRAQATGTNLGPIIGQVPTGRTMTIDVIDICRFKGGMLVEHWGVPDRFSQLQHLGLLPEPKPATS